MREAFLPASLKWRLLIMLPLGIIILAQSYSQALVFLEGKNPAWYQKNMAGMVFDACGKGYIHPRRLEPKLYDFLLTKFDTFSCADLKNGSYENSYSGSLFGLAHKYLGKTISTYWKLADKISWSGLSPLYSGYYALTILLVFIFFAHLFSPWLSFLAVFLSFQAPNVFLSFLPSFRDFSKAPFTIGILGLITWFILRKTPSRRFLLSVSLCIGILVGIGTGFRSDPIVLIPLAILIFILTPLSPPGGWGKKLLLKILCVIFLITGYVGTRPSLPDGKKQHATMHVATLGLMAPFNNYLGLKEDVYSLGKISQDEFMIKLTHFHNDWSQKHLKPITGWYPKEYEKAGFNYYLDVIRHFPADFWNRVTSAITQSLIKKIHLSSEENQFKGSFKFYIKHPYFLFLLYLFLFMILYRYKKTLFWGVLIGGAYFYSLHIAQYSPRHYFHALFLNLLPSLLLLQILLVFILNDPGKALSKWRLQFREKGFFKKFTQADSIKGGLIFSFIFLIAFGVIPWTLKIYQDQHLKQIYKKEFLEAEKLHIPYRLEKKEGDYYALIPSKNAPERFNGMYLALLNQCENFNNLKYVITSGNKPVDEKGLWQKFLKNTKWHFIPNYSEKLKITLHKSKKNCLKPFILSGKNRSFFVPVFWNVPSPYDELKFYLMSSSEFINFRRGINHNFKGFNHVPNPKKISLNLKGKRKPAQPEWILSKFTQDKILPLKIKGFPKGSTEYILYSRPIKPEFSGILVVSGRLNQGQTNIGLIHKNKWDTIANVTELDYFQVLLPVEKNKEYVLSVANLYSGRMGVDIEISQILLYPSSQ